MRVVLFTVACAAGFIASTLLFLPNRLPLVLSVPVLAFLCGYSYAKRWTPLAHYWLGAALMLSPIAAWIALVGDVAWPPVLLGLGVFFWVGGFDMIYACQDVDFDRSQRLSSVPARFGVPRALADCLFEPPAHSGMSSRPLVNRSPRSSLSGQRDRRGPAAGV